MDKKKEQKIGQQIMVIRMIRRERDIVWKGGVSFLFKEQLANGMNVPESEIDELIMLYDRLDAEEVKYRVAKELFDWEIEFGYICDTIHYYSSLYWDALINAETVSFDFEKMENQFMKSVYKKRDMIEDGDRERFKALFKKSLKHYAKTYIQEILNAYEEGVDCDVMAEIVQSEVFGEVISEELMLKLKGISLDV